MNLPDKNIVKFIKEHHVLTLATCVDEHPWCCNCFYTYLDDNISLVFTSDLNTKHIEQVKNNESVAGSIVLETKIVGKIRGIQFSGKVKLANDENLKMAKTAYLKKFPYAILMKTTLWILELNYIKLTDNRLGFGTKLIWERK